MDDGRNLKSVAKQNSLYINQVYIYQQNPDDLEVGEYVVRVKWLTPHQSKTNAYRPDPTNLGLTPNQLNGRYRTPISEINHLGLHKDLWGRFPWLLSDIYFANWDSISGDGSSHIKGWIWAESQ